MSQVAVQPTGSAPEMRTVGMSPSAARGGSLLDVRVQTQAWRVAGQRAPVGSLTHRLPTGESVVCGEWSEGRKEGEGVFLGTWESFAWSRAGGSREAG